MSIYMSGAQELRCPVCKKKFTCWSKPDWCYKTEHGLILCSWKCYRAKESEPGKHMHNYPETRKRRSVTPVEIREEQARQIVEMRKQGMRNKDIALEIGLSKSTVAQRLFEFGRQYGWSPTQKQEA